MGENACFKNGLARVETHALKTIACRNGFWTSMVDSVSVRLKTRVSKKCLETFAYSGMREPLAHAKNASVSGLRVGLSKNCIDSQKKIHEELIQTIWASQTYQL